MTDPETARKAGHRRSALAPLIQMSPMGALPPKVLVRAGLVVTAELMLSAVVIAAGLVGVGIAMIAAAVVGTTGQLFILARAANRAAGQPGKSE